MSPGMPVTAATRQAPHGGPLIGLVSDSHGRVETIAAALKYLKAERCGNLYHLGDICDSLHPESADACVELLRNYQVKSVKGNNDHSIVVNQAGRKTPSIKPETLDYLKRLPLVIQSGRMVMTHSLPFENELGLSCMVGAMHHHHARHFFHRFADGILFRGHSHSPEIIWQNHGGTMLSENILAGQTIGIAERTPCIVTCGALDLSLCMIWSPETSSISCRKF